MSPTSWRGLGLASRIASTGTAGLESLHRNVPDMIVLDCMLSDLSGDELLKIVRSGPVLC